VLAVDTAFDEWAPALSGDKLTLVFESDRAGGRDLYLATRPTVEASFGPAVLIQAVDTLASERDPTLSMDGLTMYFTSDRAGPPLLYRATRSSPVAAFANPTSVAELASVALAGPALSADGAELFYSDAGENVVIRAAWASGTGFVPEGSQTTLEAAPIGSPSLSGDGLTLYYHHVAGLFQPYQIYAAHRANPAAEFGPSAPVIELASPGTDTGEPEISKDGRTIVFSSSRPGGAGGYDLYLAERDCL